MTAHVLEAVAAFAAGLAAGSALAWAYLARAARRRRP